MIDAVKDKSAAATAGNLNAARWRVVIACFIAQNLTVGVAFGSFGPLLGVNQVHFDISRAAAASGMSLISLSIGILSPFAGGLFQWMAARSVMTIGALATAIGYAGLALTNVYPLALVMYALIGCGLAFTGILGPLAVVSRWVDRGRALVLSIVNLPLILFSCPFVVAELLPVIGRRSLLLAIAGLFVILTILLLRLIAERPMDATAAKDAAAAPTASKINVMHLLRSPPFWLMSLGIGIIAGAGTAFVVHIVPYGIANGMTLASASGLVSVYAGSGIIGTLLFGWLADRLGPPATLVLAAGSQAVLWWLLTTLGADSFYIIASALGISTVPLVTLHGAAVSALFGPQAASKAMGVSYGIKLPFIFSYAPAMGALFDRTGNYSQPFQLCALSLALATMLFMLMAWVVSVKSRRPLEQGVSPSI